MSDLLGTSAAARAPRTARLHLPPIASPDADTARLDALRQPEVDAADVSNALRLQKLGISAFTRSMLSGDVPAGATLDRLLDNVRALERVQAPPSDAAGRRAWSDAVKPVLDRARDASARLGNAVFFSGAEHLKADAAAADRTVKAFERRFNAVQERPPASGGVPWFMRPVEGLIDGARAVDELISRP